MLPMWSAAVDPRVIPARATPFQEDCSHVFDGALAAVRALRGDGREHLLVDWHGIFTRLDINDGTALAGPVCLHFDLPYDPHLETRIGAIRAFVVPRGSHRSHLQLARRIHALHATDAHEAGASLREIAELILGPGDWPGDGEYRKSLVRRMVSSGEQMRRDGAFAILGGGLNPPDRSALFRRRNREDAD
ncbi:MAG: DUF2285 domain-containing protein [Sphingobium sp.]|nr:DUF2285 domain-containing protein [Sphingobium sp.]